MSGQLEAERRNALLDRDVRLSDHDEQKIAYMAEDYGHEIVKQLNDAKPKVDSVALKIVQARDWESTTTLHFEPVGTDGYFGIRLKDSSSLESLRRSLPGKVKQDGCEAGIFEEYVTEENVSYLLISLSRDGRKDWMSWVRDFQNGDFRHLPEFEIPSQGSDRNNFKFMEGWVRVQLQHRDDDLVGKLIETIEEYQHTNGTYIKRAYPQLRFSDGRKNNQFMWVQNSKAKVWTVGARVRLSLGEWSQGKLLYSCTHDGFPSTVPPYRLDAAARPAAAWAEMVSAAAIEYTDCFDRSLQDAHFCEYVPTEEEEVALLQEAYLEKALLYRVDTTKTWKRFRKRYDEGVVYLEKAEESQHSEQGCGDRGDAAVVDSLPQEIATSLNAVSSEHVRGCNQFEEMDIGSLEETLAPPAPEPPEHIREITADSCTCEDAVPRSISGFDQSIQVEYNQSCWLETHGQHWECSPHSWWMSVYQTVPVWNEQHPSAGWIACPQTVHERSWEQPASIRDPDVSSACNWALSDCMKLCNRLGKFECMDPLSKSGRLAEKGRGLWEVRDRFQSEDSEDAQLLFEWLLDDSRSEVPKVIKYGKQQGWHELVQKLIAFGNEAQQIDIANKFVAGVLRGVSGDTYGCLTLQQLLHDARKRVLGNKKSCFPNQPGGLARTVLSIFKTYYVDQSPPGIIDSSRPSDPSDKIDKSMTMNANFVVQRWLELLRSVPEETAVFQDVLRILGDNVIEIACSKTGCRVYQRVLETPVIDQANTEMMGQFVKKLLEPAMFTALVQSSHGNYVVQHILKTRCRSQEEKQGVLNQLGFGEKFLRYASHEFARHVVSRCFDDSLVDKIGDKSDHHTWLAMQRQILDSVLENSGDLKTEFRACEMAIDASVMKAMQTSCQNARMAFQ